MCNIYSDFTVNTFCICNLHNGDISPKKRENGTGGGGGANSLQKTAMLTPTFVSKAKLKCIPPSNDKGSTVMIRPRRWKKNPGYDVATQGQMINKQHSDMSGRYSSLVGAGITYQR